MISFKDGLENQLKIELLLSINDNKKAYIQIVRTDTRGIEILGWCPAGSVLPQGETLPF